MAEVTLLPVASGPVLDPPLLRTSERSDFKRCSWRWSKTWDQGLRSRRVPVWAWFGTAIHAALEAYYRPGVKRANMIKVLDAFYSSCEKEVGRIWQQAEEGDFDHEEFAAEVVDAKVLGEAMLRGYVDHYQGDPQWEVINTEQTFQIDVPDPVTGEVNVVYAGTWDALMRHRSTKDYWLWDHKTRASFPSGSWDFYNINDQAGSYLWVAPEVLKHLGVFKKDDVIEGLVFNALRKHMPDERPINAQGKRTNKPLKAHYMAAIEAFDGKPLIGKFTLDDLADIAKHRGITVHGEVSKSQPADLFHREEIFRYPQERVTQAQRVQNEAMHMRMMREGTLPLLKVPTEDCVRCPVFDICEIDEYDPEAARSMESTMYRKTDPYRDHREAMRARKGVEL
jgi:hypothetical protein